MKPVLAIIIPYYKIDFFEETLKSVAAQTDKRFTLYIGNDASADDPLPLIQKHFPSGDYQYFNYAENLGGKNLALQWERILENVDEDWFQILGDDDVISENFVEGFYAHLTRVFEEEISVIKFTQALIDKDSLRITEYQALPEIQVAHDLCADKILRKFRSSLSEHIFQTGKYRKHRFEKFPVAWHSDDYALLKFAENGKLYFITDAYCHVRVSELSISGNSIDHNDQKDEATYLFLKNLINHHRNAFPNKDLHHIVTKYINLCWKDRKFLDINLFSIYLKLRQFKKVLKVPYLHYAIRKRISDNL